MLATPGVPTDDLGHYAVEPKLDGWRIILRVDQDGARVSTRRGRDISDALPELSTAEFKHQAVLDGELVAAQGRAGDFYRVAPSVAARRTGLTLVVFDLLWLTTNPSSTRPTTQDVHNSTTSNYPPPSRNFRAGPAPQHRTSSAPAKNTQSKASSSNAATRATDRADAPTTGERSSPHSGTSGTRNTSVGDSADRQFRRANASKCRVVKGHVRDRSRPEGRARRVLSDCQR
jgi:hypothetical protein